MPFFKVYNGELLYAPHAVHGPGYTLSRAEDAPPIAPVDGWAWFDLLEAAYSAFGLTASGAPVTAISKGAWRRRFTPAERTAFELAILDNPSDPPAARKSKAEFRSRLADFAAEDYVDLASPRTAEALASFEAAGLIGPGRADAIRTAKIDPIERPVSKIRA